MTDYHIAFLFWEGTALLFIVMGVYDRHFLKTRSAGFWANSPKDQVNDIIGFNRALGMLWIAFGCIFALSGTILLTGNTLWIALGCTLIPVFSVLGLIVLYMLVILPRYQK